MAPTSRERVRRCLTFEQPDRMPRETWVLPWAQSRFPTEIAALQERFPEDFSGPAYVYRPSLRSQGDAYALGRSTDEWGCVFENIQAGAIGEVRCPILTDLAAWQEVVRPPLEILPADQAAARAEVNRSCAASQAFMKASCCPRPWERYQFLRGTEEAMLDVMDWTPEAAGTLRRIHEFHLRELEFWCSTDVDGIMFMDDWGSQQQLLIPPSKWRELFKPLYKDYCDLARSRGKFVFMHSDGHIQAICPDLVEIGVHALNSQLFCMDLAELARLAKGHMTFWGEIDRQHVLNAADPQVGRNAVRQVAKHLYDPRGGIIAQFEVGLGANPAQWTAIHEEWDLVQAEAWG